MTHRCPCKAVVMTQNWWRTCDPGFGPSHPLSLTEVTSPQLVPCSSFSSSSAFCVVVGGEQRMDAEIDFVAACQKRRGRLLSRTSIVSVRGLH